VKTARTALVASLAAALVSVALGAAGFALKSRVVAALPAAMETAGPPLGVLHFVDNAIDSWKPMALALTIFHSPEHDRLFEALRDFQVADSFGRAGDLSAFEDSKKFQYPLSSLLPIEALRAIGFGTVRNLNLIDILFYLLELIAVVYLADRVFAASSARDRLAVAAVALAIAGTYYPVFMALTYGNIQLWIDLFFTAACVAWWKRRFFAAGLAIGLAAMIKPQFAALLLWAVLWRQWRFGAGFLAVAVPVGLASLAYFGLHNNLAYLDVLSLISQHGERYYLNESVNGIVHRLIEDGSTPVLAGDLGDYAPYRQAVYGATLIAAAIFAAIALLPAWRRAGEGPDIVDLALAATCFTIGAPVVWPYHYGILLPVFVVALKAALDRPRALAVLAVAWVLCASYLPLIRLVYHAPWNLAGNPCFFGAILLIGVLVYCRQPSYRSTETPRLRSGDGAKGGAAAAARQAG